MKSCFQQTLYLVLGALAIGVLVFALLSTGVLTLEAGSNASNVFFTTAAAISALGGLALACRALRCDCSPALICAWLCSARCAGFGALGGVLTALAASLVASSAVLVNVGAALCLFFLTLLPLTGGSHVNLMKAESPGPQVDKLVPKVQSTAKLLYGIYLALTLAQLVFLMAGGMPLFESLLTAFGTAGTGGFGFKNDSFAQFSPYIQWVVTIFMILFGVNFNFYFLLLLRRFRRAVSSEEVRAYLGIILVSIGIITLNIRSMYSGLGEALRHAAFQVGSIITTTGFSSCDFDLWPTLSKQLLVLLMFVGACAGSTGGGMKVSRILIFRKTVGKELKQAMHPQVVAPVRMDGKLLSHETIRTTNVYLCAYLFILVASIMLISLDGFDMVTNFTAVAATLNNIGPGLSQVGPMMNFAGFSNPAKLVLIFDMLAGRLELFPMLVLFLPSAWRKF